MYGHWPVSYGLVTLIHVIFPDGVWRCIFGMQRFLPDIPPPPPPKWAGEETAGTKRTVPNDSYLWWSGYARI